MPESPHPEFDCPACQPPKKLTYVATLSSAPGAYQMGATFKTANDLHYYECPAHGRFHAGPDGMLHPG